MAAFRVGEDGMADSDVDNSRFSRILTSLPLEVLCDLREGDVDS